MTEARLNRETPLDWILMGLFGLGGIAYVVRRLGRLSGSHVAIGFVHFFAVIFTVNFYMASQALGTFPGVEGRNTYYVSQNFEAARQAQMALGWDVVPDYANGELIVRITEESTGNPAALKDFTLIVGRATTDRDDKSPVFVRESGAFVAPVDLAPGKWLLRMTAVAEDGTRFRQNMQLFVKG